MYIFRCLICGDTFVTREKPTNCPYCGSDQEYIVLTVDYPEGLNDVELTDQEHADILRSASLEWTNAQFYSDLGKIAEPSSLSSMYRHLAKIEREHLSVFSKLLKTPVDDLPFEREVITLKETWAENIASSSNQEVEARDFYAEAAARATTPRVKQVLTAISQVEDTHIDADNQALEIAKK